MRQRKLAAAAAGLALVVLSSPVKGMVGFSAFGGYGIPATGWFALSENACWREDGYDILRYATGDRGSLDWHGDEVGRERGAEVFFGNAGLEAGLVVSVHVRPGSRHWLVDRRGTAPSVDRRATAITLFARYRIPGGPGYLALGLGGARVDEAGPERARIRDSGITLMGAMGLEYGAGGRGVGAFGEVRGLLIDASDPDPGSSRRGHHVVDDAWFFLSARAGIRLRL